LTNARIKNFLSLALLAVAFLSGCQKKQTENEAIREAVKQHLLSLKTLNLAAMDTEFTNISIQDTHATAQVSFRPKNGAPTGAAMQVAYQLEKQNGAWSVLKTAAMGGMIEHPAAGANPHTLGATGESHGNLPNFKELIASPGTSIDSSTRLPPGHPPVPATAAQAPK
jgi:carbon monoxide dehydrogenase subunit G